MDKNSNQSKNHDNFAENYDEEAQKYNSHGHEIIFGMNYDYLQPGQRLLDLGIGTGLSSRLFAKAGLKVVGVDGSKQMLVECRKKNFAENLILHDINNIPLPLEMSSYDFVISCGVFHFLGDLEPVFSEIKRLLKGKGIFSFSIASIAETGNSSINENYISEQTPWNVPIYKHSDAYIFKLIKENGFNFLKKQRLLISGGDPNKEDLLFTIFCARKI